MRYIEVTHTYVIPVPADDMDVIEPLAREGMSIMEGFMSARAGNAINLRSDWKLMPKEYHPDAEQAGEITITPALQMSREDFGSLAERAADREESKYAIENDLDRGVSFAGDIMGQQPKITHPWDNGLRVTPLDGSDISRAETRALEDEGFLCPDDMCHLVAGHAGPHRMRIEQISA